MNYQSSRLSDLIEGFASTPVMDEAAKLSIMHMALSSNQLQPGWLFVALPGGKQHGIDFVAEAQKRGACGILIDERDEDKIAECSLPSIAVRDLTNNLTMIADRLYEHPSVEWSAVTGTNGKSSVAHLVAQSMTHCSIRTAAIGTVYQGFVDDGSDSDFLTTPDTISLRRLQAEFCQQHAQHIVVEASSHALAQRRLADLNITTGMLTNITMDHGDYHLNRADYVAAKRSLFELPSLKQGVFNLDDEQGKQWFTEFKPRIDCLSYSLNDTNADIYADSVQVHAQGIKAYIKTMGKRIAFCSSLVGSWQLANVLASLALLLLKQIPLDKAVAALSQAGGLRGRMQQLRKKAGASFYIDYAHTTDSLRRVLKYLSSLCRGKLWVVFGCGGDRDQQKRAAMGEVAANYADRIILTNDNPRFEDPLTIIKSIKEGIKQHNQVYIEMDRAKALDMVIAQAGADDLVLVAGKGHENYQEIAGRIHPFNDYTYLAHRLC